MLKNYLLKYLIQFLTIVFFLFVIHINSFCQELNINDFKFDGPLGSKDTKITRIGKNHFKVILGHAPDHHDWSNMLQFEIIDNAKGNNLRLNVEFPEDVDYYKFNHYSYSWSYDGINWNPVHWRENPYNGKNTDVLVFPVFEKDKVIIGHQVPLSYVTLKKLITDWEKDPYVKVHVIGKSLEGRDIYRLEVTDFKERNKQWVHYFNNQHPGEHNSQWRMVGVLEWLLGEGRSYCENNIHHFIFMMSPDAPFHGWYRTNAEGVDMNRSYSPEGADKSRQAHEPFICQKDLEAIMQSEYPVTSLWSMHTWQGAVEPIITPGPEFGTKVGHVEDLKSIIQKNDTLSYFEPLKSRPLRPEHTIRWTDGPHSQFGITTILVEGAGNIYTKKENIHTGKVLMKSIAEFYK